MASSLIVSSAIAVAICLICAALASGLTQGLLTIDIMDLMIKGRSGTDEEQKNAKRLLPLLNSHHLLICTLMLWNATANEILPLYLSNLVPEWVALILSVSLLLIVGEILPSAILTGPNQVQFASMLAPLVYVILALFSPIAYPISLLLDVAVGEDEAITTYNKLELEQLVKIQHEEMSRKIGTGSHAGHSHDAVNNEEVNMIAGVLKFANVLVKEKMSREIFSLDVNDRLDLHTLNKIFRSGYSRIPIYDGDKNNIIGLVLTKELLFVDLQDALPIRTFMSMFPRSILGVQESDTLSEVLRMFQETRTHLAVVYADVEAEPPLSMASNKPEMRDDGSAAVSNKATDVVVGIITLEDIVECIIGEDIKDETDQDDIKLGHEERDMEIIRLRLLNPAQATGQGKTFKLSANEVQAVAAHLKANVPEVMAMLADHAESNLTDYVTGCKVVEVAEGDIEHFASQRGGLSDSKPLPSTGVAIGAAVGAGRLSGPNKKPIFFKRGEPANTAILILSGRVDIMAGREGFKLELGAWAVLGQQALVNAEDQYIPDFSMFMKSPTIRVLCLNKPKAVSRTRQRSFSFGARSTNAMSETGSMHSSQK